MIGIMNVELRRANKEDIPALIGFEKKVAGSRLFSPMLTEKEWLKAFETDEIYFIEADGASVGELSYEIKSPAHAYFSGLVVDPTFQGRGVGTKAIQLALERLAAIPKIDLVTHPENEAAIKIYQSFGFKITERLENYFGDGEPRVRMVLER